MRTLHLSIPTVTGASPLLSRVREKLVRYLSSVASSYNDTTERVGITSKLQIRKIRRFMKNPFVGPFLIIAVVILLLIVLSLHHIFTQPASPVTTATNDGRVQLHKPISSETLNKSFSFPLKDSTGKEISQLKFLVQSVEVRDQIIIQGKVANATIGKDVLIANLELTNSYTKPIEITTRNYVRLMKNNDGKLYDPKIHNDPVDVQPISTTITRVGFTIDDTDKNFILRIGDVTDPAAKIQEFKLILK